ncbi:hypothetical protein THASP1DRAFT_30386 [Thamnocephalis sphaerospora]|uniref:Uncharacterized protein n=1 Tax=Thamnocephalis sphaerospora TaxID=78915 RepID=A0A4P9XPA3_9FUNG|nr:hypothetical protein THASP1DRAFT_30386 [Thamnocephalis sphaerospora]|eukprot:RKP07808.1 hypothetical protein THASP1DRAFT_30386 [Thamnocephalis sphaerospora]
MSEAASVAAPAAPTGQVIELPLNRPGEFIDISCDELPVTPADDLTPILYEERVPLQYYLRLALEYNKRNLANEAVVMLERGLSAPYETTRQAKLPLMNCQAALLLSKASKQSTAASGQPSGSGERDSLLSRVAELLNRASEVDPQDQTTLVIRGQWLLARRQLDEADRQFQQVLARSPSSIPALYGKARILYSRNQYVQALDCYQRVLRLRPDARPDPRVGVGLCFERLGMRAQARTAFERAVEVNPGNAGALVLLAIMDLNDVKRAINKECDAAAEIATNGAQPAKTLSAEERRRMLERAQAFLLRALRADKHHAPAACGLADQFFFNRQMPNVIKCATVACKTADSDGLRAESHFQLARAYHYQGHYNEADSNYRRALSFNAGHTLAQFGQAQMLVQSGDYDGATEAFEKLRKEDPDCVDILMILASLYASSGKALDRALQCFDRVASKLSETSSVSVDAELFAEMGSALVEKDAARALRAYRRAVPTYAARDGKAPIAVANNLAVLEHQAANFAAANTIYRDVYERCKCAVTSSEKAADDADGANSDSQYTTVTYNLARLAEDEGRLEEARELYEDILKRHPTYTDARLRLSTITTDSAKSMEHLVLELRRRPPPAAASLLMAERYLLVPRVDPRKARKHFETVLQAHDRYDIWALCGTGWQHVLQARRETTRGGCDKSLKKAYEFFTIALRQDAHCAQAVNGLAVVLAESGLITEARDIFAQVRETSAAVPGAWINLAHAQAALGQYQEALNMYETCARRFPGMACDPQLWLCAANQLYRAARAENDSAQMRRAIRYVEKALHIEPDNLMGLYNLALGQQTYAYMVGDLESQQRTVAMLSEALAGLENAKRLFQRLATHPGDDEQLPYSRKIADQRQKYGDSLMRRIQERQQIQADWEAERDRTLKQALEERERLRQEREAAVAEEQQKREAEERRIEEHNRRIQQQAQLDMMLKDDEENEEGDGGRAGRKRYDSDASEGGSGQENGSAGKRGGGRKKNKADKPRKRGGAGKKTQRVASDDDAAANEEDQAVSGAESDKRTTKKRKGRLQSKAGPPAGDADGGDNEGEDNVASSRKRPKYLSNAIVDSDDDDDDDYDGAGQRGAADNHVTDLDSVAAAAGDAPTSPTETAS